MKIALLGSRGIPASYSGFETFYEQLATRLVMRGHTVTVYNRAHHVKYMEKEYKGVRLVRLPSIPSKHLDTISHTFISLVHALISGNDIYYICIVGNSPLCLLTKALRRKTVVNVDGADAEREKWRGFAKNYLRFAEKAACRLADVIIADSTVISKRYIEKYNRDTVFIPYGANPWPREKEAGNTDVLKRFGLEPDGYILFTSRLTPENCAHLLIEAYRKSRTRLKLVIVGDAPYSDEYKAGLKAMCDENVIMTGYLFGDVYRQISCHCRFFVLPSGIDGTRPVLLDQLGFGNCVVVKDTPANMEVIADSGLSFSRLNEVDSLREKIEELSQDYEKIKEFRSRAIRRIEEEYSWERVVDKYEDLFISMKKRSAGGAFRL